MPLPDDDDVPVRRRAAMDEVADSHATMGIKPISAPISTTAPATATTGATGATGLGGFGSGFGTAGSTGMGGFGSGFGTSGTSTFGSPMGGFGASGMGGMNNAQQGGAMQEGGVAAIQTDKGFSDFINKRWRPLMAVIYMVTCFTDFVIFPILWSILQATSHGTVTSQWAPLTLQGAGLYHIAMGAVLGLAAYGRSQEKIAGKA